MAISVDAVKGNYIAKFFQENGIWKEFRDAPFGIGQDAMNNLLAAKMAIKIEEIKGS